MTGFSMSKACRSATSGRLEGKNSLKHLAPQRGFISSEPFEYAVVEMGKALETVSELP
jgi:hypothetical protein